MPTRLHSCATFEKGCAIVVQQGSQKANMEDLKAKIEVPKQKFFWTTTVTVIYIKQYVSLRAC
jgi:hypothetical protein